MPDNRPPDTHLIARCRAGDRAAFDTLVKRYRGAVYAVALRQLGDPDLAADVTQEALVAAYASLPSLRDPARFAAWLRSITGHLCADEVTGLARARREPGEARPGTEPDALAEIERAEVQRSVREAVESLSSANRLAVNLFYFDGLSCREVAEFCGVSVSAVKSRLHAARQALREGNTRMGSVEKPWRGRPAGWIGYTGELDFGALFGPGDLLREFYSCLYPARRRDDREFWESWKPDLDVEDVLAGWVRAGVVQEEDGEVVGQVPIYTETDHQLFAAWHARASQAMLARIRGEADALRKAEAEFDDTSGDEANLHFITLIGRLMAGGVCAVLDGRIVDTAHDWGGLGHAYVFGRQPGLPCTGGYSLHTRASKEGGATLKTFQDNYGRFAGKDALDGGGAEPVLRVLAALAEGPMLGERAADLAGDDAEPEGGAAAIDRLTAARWVTEDDGEIALALPWLPWGPDEDDERMMQIAERICEPMVATAHELRVLSSRCSFARCRFADAAYLVTNIAIGYVVTDLLRKGAVMPYEDALQPGRGAWLYARAR